MTPPDPRNAAQAVLPTHRVLAAGIFGLQDHGAAAGLLGQAQVATTLARLTGPRRAPAGAGQEQWLARIEAMAPFVAIPVLVAVSDSAIHICDWGEWPGASRELTRFPRAASTAVVDTHRSARRLVLTDRASGYSLALTATVSPLNGAGRDVKAVLALLATAPALAAAPAAPAAPTDGQG